MEQALYRHCQAAHKITIPGNNDNTCVAPSTKKKKNADFLHKRTTGERDLYLCIFIVWHCVPFCRNASHTSVPKIHYPAMDSLVLSLQPVWQKRQQFSRRPRAPTLSLQVSKCGSSRLHVIFPVLYPSNNFTAARAGASTSRGTFLFCFFGFVQEDTSVW